MAYIDEMFDLVSNEIQPNQSFSFFIMLFVCFPDPRDNLQKATTSLSPQM